MSQKTSSAANGDIDVLHDPKKAAGAAVEQGRRVVTGLTGMYLLVAGAVSLSWLVGYLDFSYVWSFLLTAALFVIWKAKIKKIIKQYLNIEEADLYRRRAFRQNETAEWLNFLLNRWWVFSSSTIEQLIKKRLDERLWDIKPRFLDNLEVTSFTTGEQTPSVRNVQVFEYCEGVVGSRKPISWFNVNKPPAGLDKMTSYQLVVQFDTHMICDDFRMVFRARVGSKKVNMSFDMALEDLQLSGMVQAILHLSMDVPFPHIAKATISFVDRPEVTFNLHLMKTLQMMEVPLLKSWIYTNIMETLSKAMVDPASLDVTLSKAGPIEISHQQKKKKMAQGVLTLHLKGTPPKDPGAEDVRYTVLFLRNRKRQTHDVPATEEWTDVCSFFMYDLAKEEIQVKSKCRRLLMSTTLEYTKVNLASFPLQVKGSAETTITNKDGSTLQMKMHYTALPAIDLSKADAEAPRKTTEVAGVMYLCIHGASNVKAADKTGASDPYCVLFCDRRRLLTTPYVMDTRNPRWESWVEFFVGDFTKSTLSFFVFDWDGTNTIDDDFLGVAHLSLSKEESVVIKKTLVLGYNKPNEGFTPDKSCGQITVSLVFRPVASVAKSERFRDSLIGFKGDEYLYCEDLMSPASVATTLYHPRQLWDISDHEKDKDLGPPRRSTSAALCVDKYLEDKLIAELTILQGKDLMAMDRNGFSDPYCVVSLAGKKVFTTAVKKKTLFPKWNETVTLDIKDEDTAITIDVFDKDVISKDFLGKVTLDTNKLKELSVKDSTEWFTLERTKTGMIQLKCHVISKDTLISPTDLATNDVFDSASHRQVTNTATINNSFPSSMGSNKGGGSDGYSGMPDIPPILESPALQRSVSDVAINKMSSESVASPPSQYNTLQPQKSSSRHSSGHGIKATPSLRSVEMRYKDRGDTVSLNEKDEHNTTLETTGSAVSTSDKFFGVSGVVHRVRGMMTTNGEVYCKVRLELPGSRLSLFSGSRVLGKSRPVPSSQPIFDLKFEVDKGSGITPDAVLIVDIKTSHRTHVARDSFTLRHILEDSEAVCRWLPLKNNVEVELSLSLGQNSPRHRRSVFKSLSFRKEK